MKRFLLLWLRSLGVLLALVGAAAGAAWLVNLLPEVWAFVACAVIVLLALSFVGALLFS